MLHKTRELPVRQRVMLTNALRAHLGEFGIIAAQGLVGMKQLLELFHGIVPQHYLHSQVFVARQPVPLHNALLMPGLPPSTQ